MLFEQLETRSLLATFTVLNTNDSGPDSLRQAIDDANANPGLDAIEFDIPGPGVHTISPASTLPFITDPVTIDGYTQPGASPNTLAVGNDAVLKIRLDGGGTLGEGLIVWTGAAGSTVRGLVINGFYTGLGMHSGVTVEGNFIGTDPTGTAVASNVRGVSIRGAGNQIGTDGNGLNDLAERNLISGNAGSGVDLNGGLGVTDNVIAGNYIGTDKTGLAALGNGQNMSANGGHGEGVFLTDVGSNNRIGTNGDGMADDIERNLISANAGSGVNLEHAYDSIIAGNYIGTDVTGMAALGNRIGVEIRNGSQRNRVGTDGSNDAFNANERNVISGSIISPLDANTGIGVGIFEDATRYNVVAGNFIGTDATGSAALPNTFGVVITFSSDSNLIGTNGDGSGDLEERNIISGNSREGIVIGGTGADDNTVAGNYIGTDVTGAIALANSGQAGVLITHGAQNNLIGTKGDGSPGDAAEGNLISGNFPSVGVRIRAVGSDHNVVAGNLIGTDATGTLSLRNYVGVDVIPDGGSGPQFNFIGTNGDGVSDELERNIISGNDNLGVELAGLGVDSNVVAGNFIGTDVTGTLALGNYIGIYVHSIGIGGPQFNRIGTDGNGTADAAERNIISGNITDGVLIGGPGNEQNTLAGNSIGVNVSGTALGNGGVGVHIFGAAANNQVGMSGHANTIAFSGGAGVVVRDTNTTGNRIQGNSIHSNGGLGIDLQANGVSPNDYQDGDIGGNNLQNFPTITLAEASASTHVAGSINSTPNTTLVLDFYASAAADPSGHGEGQRFLGSTTVITNGSGNANYDTTLAAASTFGEFITATATDPVGNTSEFSAAIVARIPADAFSVSTQAALNTHKSGNIVATVSSLSADNLATLALLATGGFNFRFVFTDDIATVTVAASLVAGSYLGTSDTDFALSYRNPGPDSPLNALVTAANKNASTAKNVRFSAEVNIDGTWYELGSTTIKTFLSKK